MSESEVSAYEAMALAEERPLAAQIRRLARMGLEGQKSRQPSRRAA